MRRWLTLLAVMSAFDCGDDGRGGGVVPAALLRAADGADQPITAIDFGATAVGQSSTVTIYITNAGTADTGTLALAIMGDAANDFVFDNQLTTCAAAVLASGQTCSIALAFRPLASGARAAAITVTAGANLTVTIALQGQGFMTDLTFVPSSIDFGQIEALNLVTRTLELHNNGIEPAPLDGIEAIGTGFQRGSSTCGATLAPGASCDIAVTFAAAVLGARNGELRVTSGTTTVAAPLSGHAARRITVVRDGAGTGSVTSVPAGISCGTTCDAMFETDVTLTATADANSVLTGWSEPSCGSSTTCTIAADLQPVTVHASFALTGTGALQVTFAGDAAGEVRVERAPGNSSTCFGPCSVPIGPGEVVTVSGVTPSTFGGLTGACTASPTAGKCSFTAPAGTSAITATFSKDPKEQWTRLLSEPVIAVAHDATGNVIAGTAHGITKLSSAGATAWTLSLPVSGLATGPGDTIYVVTGTNLEKLDALGNPLWTVALDTNSTTACGMSYDPAQCLAVGSDGAVAVHGSGVARWDSNGNPTWSFSLTSSQTGVAIDAQGVVYAAVTSALGEVKTVRRFLPSGTEIVPMWSMVGSEYHGEIAIDADGLVVASTSGFGKQYFNRTKADGSADYFRRFSGSFPSYARNGVTTSSASTIAWWYLTGDEYLTSNTSYVVAVFTDANTDVWSLQRPIFGFVSAVPSGSNPQDASYHGDQLVLAGQYQGFSSSLLGWVQAFTP